MKVSTLLVPSCLAYVTNAMIRDPAFAGVQAASSMEKDLLIREITEMPALVKRAEDVEQPHGANVGHDEPSNGREESGQVHLQKRGQDHSKGGGGGKKSKGSHSQSKKKGSKHKKEKHDLNEENTQIAVGTARDRPRGPSPNTQRRRREHDASLARIEGHQAQEARRQNFHIEARALGYVGRRRDEFNQWLEARGGNMIWSPPERAELLRQGFQIPEEPYESAPPYPAHLGDFELPPYIGPNSQPPSFHTNPLSRRPSSSQPRSRSSRQSRHSSQPSQRSSQRNTYQEPDSNAFLNAPFDTFAPFDAHAGPSPFSPSGPSNQQGFPNFDPTSTLSGPFVEGGDFPQYTFGDSSGQSSRNSGQSSRRSGQSSRQPHQ